MVIAVDLEGFERAYRLRNSADDDLLSQVFGKDELASLTESRRALIETARSYFPHLTSSTYDRLIREPDALQLEQDRCASEMEQLAVQNYGAFIGSAKVTQAVRHGLADIQESLEKMTDSLQPMQEGIREFQAVSAGLASRRSALRNVLQQHTALLELLELPQLLDACVRYHMYDESLELLAYCGSLLQAHEARGESISVLSQLQDQVAVQRTNLHSSLVAQLRTDIHLPACVRVMGFLRRIQRHSEEELRSLFIEHRGSFLEGHKQQVEQLRGNRGSFVTALRNAADLLRTHVYDIGTQYKALFPQDDGPLGSWLSEQIAWLTGLLRAHLLPHHVQQELGSLAQSASSPTKSSAAGSRIAGAGGWGEGTVARIDATSLATILRQCHIASSTLKRLGGHFFPAVAGIFEARMEHLICEMLDAALLTFHAELGRYDWIPTTALAAGGVGGSAGVIGIVSVESGSLGGGGPTYLHPQALELTRHRPLAVFANEMVQVFNELRQCALYDLRTPTLLHCFECVTGAVNLLRSVLGSQAFQQGSNKAAEFARLCRHFAHILVPLVSSHLETVFGPSGRLDADTIIAGMVPDLLPASEAEYPLPSACADELVVEGELAVADEAALHDSVAAAAVLDSAETGALASSDEAGEIGRTEATTGENEDSLAALGSG